MPTGLLEEMKFIGLKFFESPLEEKLKYACNSGSAASEGYGSRMLVKEEQVLDWRDYFDHHTLPLSRRNPRRWPQHPPSYRLAGMEFISDGCLIQKFVWSSV